MGKLIKFLIFMTFLSSSIFAVPNYVILEKNIDGASNYAHIDPIISAQNELDGFVFSDSALNSIILYDLQSDSILTLPLDRQPVKSIHYFSDTYDSIYIYTLTNKVMDYYGLTPQITKHTIYDQGINVENIELNIFSNFALIKSAITQDIRFVNYGTDNIKSVCFEGSFYFEDLQPTMGEYNEHIPTTIIFSVNDHTQLLRENVDRIYSGQLIDETNPNLISYYNYYHKWNDRHSFGLQIQSDIFISDNLLNEQLTYQSDQNVIVDAFIGQFYHTSATDEIIIHGTRSDLNNQDFDEEHLAAYRFDNNFAEELWYLPISDISFEYVYAHKDNLIGRRGDNEVIFLDYLNGQIADSSNLLRDINNISFYESGEYPDQLNLVGNNHDTIFVYRFDTPTWISNQPDVEIIPETFDLFQNHPNPFNGETRIEFKNDENQSLTLKIYNILGQEIKHLADDYFGLGYFTFYWDGTNEDGLDQSTGIYFARLESSSSSQMIKLIYIK